MVRTINKNPYELKKNIISELNRYLLEQRFEELDVPEMIQDSLFLRLNTKKDYSEIIYDIARKNHNTRNEKVFYVKRCKEGEAEYNQLGIFILNPIRDFYNYLLTITRAALATILNKSNFYDIPDLVAIHDKKTIFIEINEKKCATITVRDNYFEVFVNIDDVLESQNN